MHSTAPRARVLVVLMSLLGTIILVCVRYASKLSPINAQPQIVHQRRSNGEQELAEQTENATTLMILQGRLDALESRERQAEPTVATSAAPAVSPVPSRQQLLVRESRQLVQLESSLRMEARDRSWAPVYESELRRSIEPGAVDGGHTNIASIECRTSVCRIELSHASESEQQQVSQQVSVGLPEMAGARFVFHRADDGAATTEILIVRHGYEWPEGDIVGSGLSENSPPAKRQESRK
jgi:hypothetical protein